MARDESEVRPVELVRRGELLAALLVGPKTPAELESETASSRSTVHRSLESLRQQEVIASTGDAFELTGFGHVVARQVVDAREAITSATRLRPFLRALGEAAREVPVRDLATAETTVSDPAHAHVAVRRLTELLGNADRVRLMLDVISPIYLEIAFEQVRDGAAVEGVFERGLVEVLFSEYANDAREAARTGRFRVRTFDACPFSLFVCDETVAIAAHEDGLLRALVESDDSAVHEWAVSLYEEYVNRSEYVTLF